MGIGENDALTNIDGLSNLTSVGEYLIIYNNDALTNLDGLSGLTNVGQYLSIQYNDVLVNLDGLSGLSSVVWHLSIENNDALTNVDGLSSLTSVGEYLTISFNSALTNLDGLSSLTSVAAFIAIKFNNSLTSLNGLSSLTSLGGRLTIERNTALINLDGLSGLTSIVESLFIDQNDALTNLDGLSGLTSVGEDLGIRFNNALTNLDGLSRLTSLGGGLYIYGNNALTNLDGLSNLTSVESLTIDGIWYTSLDHLSGITSVVGSLTIGLTTGLTNLDGLSNLTSVGGSVSIQHNHALTSLDGLSNLSSVGEDLLIFDNGTLTDLNGLSNLTNVGLSLLIDNNAVLANLNGLSRLTSLSEDLYISNSTKLTNLNGLSNIASVGGSLAISGIDALTDLDDLSNLTSVGRSLIISDNGTLTNLDGLSSITSVGQSLTINYNDALINLNGLSSLTGVGEQLSIYDNDALTKLDGLSNITSVGAHLLIYYNDALTSLAGLSGLTSVGHDLSIHYNDSLTNLDHLSNLTSVGQSVSIEDNDALTNIDGLSNLSRVGRSLFIHDNDTLTNLDGLSKLTSLDQSVSIQYNDALTNLDGLSRLIFVGAYLTLTDNSYLGDCTGLIKLVDNVDHGIQGPGPGEAGIPDIGRNVDIHSNLYTCNSVAAILASASVDSDGDGVPDVRDNCPSIPNPNQQDSNGNGIGDACEESTVTDQKSQVVKAFESAGQLERSCRGVAEINGELLALIHVDDYGCELWRIDPDGEHELFADINAGEASSDISYNFGDAPLFQGWSYFSAYDEVNKHRLWRTDGVNLEPVQEVEPVPDGFENHGIPLYQTGFIDRNYFMAQPLGEYYQPFSTDGDSMRAEPPTPLANNGRITGFYTLFDKMIVTINDEIYGHEPWVFDGIEYKLLRDLMPGRLDSLTGYSRSSLWFYFDESWVFQANVVSEPGRSEFAYFYTDGDRVIKLPHKGTSSLNEFNALSAFIHTREAQYAVGTTTPESGAAGIPVLRISKDATSDYELTTAPDKLSYGSGAVLNNEALVLANNRLFRLGETSAEELPFDLPSDWINSVFNFVGSGEYFSHAYIKETGDDGDSRIWVWNHTGAGLLMADDTHVVTNTDSDFRHIGNDIYFYGEDQLTGMALRKIPDAVIKPVPRLAAVTGSWYDPATSGQGFVLLSADDNTTVFYFYGFENDGKPLWLTGVARDMLETGYTTEVTMYITSGGNFGSFTPDQISSEPWGTLNITFDTCSKATAELNGLSGQQSMNMVRLAGLKGLECFYFQTPPEPESAGLTGGWFDRTTSGQGFALHPITDGQMLVSFYGYKNNSERLWLVGNYQGQVSKGEPLVINIIFASGGKFGGFAPQDITRTSWGTLTINFTDCNHATATLNGIDGQQTMNMVKLVGLQGSELDCH